MNYYIFENIEETNFYPVSATRATIDIRIGTGTFFDRIKNLISSDDQISLFVREEIEEITQERHPEIDVNPHEVTYGIWLAGNVFWTSDLLKKINQGSESVWVYENSAVGYNLSKSLGESWLYQGGPVKSEFSEKIEKRNMSCDMDHYVREIIDLISYNTIIWFKSAIKLIIF